VKHKKSSIVAIVVGIRGEQGSVKAASQERSRSRKLTIRSLTGSEEVPRPEVSPSSDGEAQDSIVLVEQISDEREIAALEEAIAAQAPEPLQVVYEFRARLKREDEEFGDYVEDLLSKPYVRPEIQEHGVQWLKSKIRIEEYQRSEDEATRVIAKYACKVYQDNPKKTEFVLAGPTAQVQIKVFALELSRLGSSAERGAA